MPLGYLLRNFFMASDLNVVVTSGVIESAPNVVLTRHNNRVCVFTLKNTEEFTLANGKAARHVNIISIEALGRNVDKCMTRLAVGNRVRIHGYYRVDEVNGVLKTRLRMHYFEIEA